MKLSKQAKWAIILFGGCLAWAVLFIYVISPMIAVFNGE